jgi:hypothetical protein
MNVWFILRWLARLFVRGEKAVAPVHITSRRFMK